MALSMKELYTQEHSQNVLANKWLSFLNFLILHLFVNKKLSLHT